MADKFHFICQHELMGKDCLDLFNRDFEKGPRFRNQLVLSAMNKETIWLW